MKKYVISILMLAMSSSVFAEAGQDDIPLEACKEMAAQQELTGEDANNYISECLKTFEIEEKEDVKEDEKDS